ncbi:MAG: DUF4125 family protein [Lachnospiraceae bacterium]|nr:DUF4125 family protein [Lachnospiraceae bacterium]
MDINQVLTEYDSMFGVKGLDEIEAFLVEQIDKAYAEPDYYSAVTLLNEIIGFCRDTSQNEKGLKYCEQDLKLMREMGLEGGVEYATSLLNVANAYRAFGKWEDSLALYQQTQAIYQKKLPAGEFNYASLYNNWSLLYQEMQDFDNARIMLEKALEVVYGYPDAVMPIATTHCNLAVTLLHLYQEKQRECQKIPEHEDMSKQAKEIYSQAVRHLKKALEIHERDGGQDMHYSGVLSAMGDALYLDRRYGEAAEYYAKAMKELEKHVGRTEAYDRVAENYAAAVRLSEEASDRQGADQQGTGCSEEEHPSTEHPGVGQSVFVADRQASEEDEEPEAGQGNLVRCRRFYEDYGAPMIHEMFPEYEHRIAVGMVGEGSDCFGFDDEISKDHDYGIGFCMWLLPEDDRQIGEVLQKEYDRLIDEYRQRLINSRGYEADIIELFLKKRRGVFEIHAFYEDLLGTGAIWNVQEDVNKPLRDDVWQRLAEERLATVVNGEVFRDDLGTFTAIREQIRAYYSDEIRGKRMAEKLHEFSQYAQSNYSRMMARKDYVTAKICVAEGMKAAMELCYLLDRVYAPYYKWMRKGMETLGRRSAPPQKIIKILDRISGLELQAEAWENVAYDPVKGNHEDQIMAAFDQIAEELLDEMEWQGLVQRRISMDGQPPFLENYIGDVLERKASAMSKEEYVEKIVALEWKQFDKVENEGGRADCQNNWNTFSIMRKSQYLTWTEELLASFYQDLMEADERGWNLITEKYARMMESTAPEKYAGLEKDLPKRSEERIAIQEEIIKIQVGWMEEFADKYPKMAGNARSIHTSEDTPYNTSYETYLRGELGTYSEETLILYGRFIVSVQQAGKNLAYEIMNQTALLYGYESVKDAEEKL